MERGRAGCRERISGETDRHIRCRTSGPQPQGGGAAGSAAGAAPGSGTAPGGGVADGSPEGPAAGAASSRLLEVGDVVPGTEVVVVTPAEVVVVLVVVLVGKVVLGSGRVEVVVDARATGGEGSAGAGSSPPARTKRARAVAGTHAGETGRGGRAESAPGSQGVVLYSRQACRRCHQVFQDATDQKRHQSPSCDVISPQSLGSVAAIVHRPKVPSWDHPLRIRPGVLGRFRRCDRGRCHLRSLVLR